MIAAHLGLDDDSVSIEVKKGGERKKILANWESTNSSNLLKKILILVITHHL